MIKKIINRLLDDLVARITQQILYNLKTEQQILYNLKTELEKQKLLLIKCLIEKTDYSNLSEFSVFSQWGQDGILQYLIHHLNLNYGFFVEFGVQNYEEATTRFLMMNNNWSGLIMDGSFEFIQHIQNQEYYWKYDLKAVHAFITRNNINSLLNEHCPKNIDLLVIDIDGNDYWIWDTIEGYFPKIVVCEFNSIFGANLALTVPYKEDFYRTREHFSNLYFGASLKALEILANKKGYDLVYVNNHGNDAFFVKTDINPFPKLTAQQAYKKSKFRESRDKNGNLTYISGSRRIEVIKDMELFDIEKGEIVKIADILGQI